MKKLIAANPLPVVLFTVFVDMIGFGILIPVIPQLLANPGSEFYLLRPGDSIAHGYILLGYLTAIFPFMQFLATPILGELSDSFGRKKILAISLFGTSISYILFAVGIVTKNIPLLFAARAFDGITGGNIAVAQAAIADVTEPQNRSRAFGLVGAAFGLGFILGPYIGGKLSDPTIVSWFDATTPFYFAAGLAFLNVISVLTIFPETLKEKRELVIKWNKAILNIVRAYGLGPMRAIFATQFLYQAGFSFFVTFFSVFLINRFGFGQGNIGDFFSWVGLWVVIAQAIVVRRALKVFNEKQILNVSILATSFLLLAFFLPKHVWQLLLITPFFATFNGLSFASSNGLVSRTAGAEIQGEILGINASVLALAQTIPPVLSGYIAASIKPETPLIAASVVVFLSGVTFILFYKLPAGFVHNSGAVNKK